MNWTASDVEMQKEPLDDYDLSQDQDSDLSINFLGTWSPCVEAADDILDLQNFVALPSEAQSKIQSFATGNITRLYPDGNNWAEVSAVVKRGEHPVPGISVDFSVSAIRPTNGWRDVNEVAKRMRGNAKKFRNRVSTGRIKLLGIMSPTTAITDENGVVTSKYVVSNVGGNGNTMALERITLSSQAGVSRHDILIGYDLVDVPTVNGGLRIVGATGRHCQRSLSEFLDKLGQAVANAKWPQPVTVTAASLRWGGLYPPHLSHQHGGTLDLRPMSIDGKPTWCKTSGKHKSNYDRKRTKILIQALIKGGATRLYFNDPQMARHGASSLQGHDHHIHVSWIPPSAFVTSVQLPELDVRTIVV